MEAPPFTVLEDVGTANGGRRVHVRLKGGRTTRVFVHPVAIAAGCYDEAVRAAVGLIRPAPGPHT